MCIGGGGCGWAVAAVGGAVALAGGDAMATGGAVDARAAVGKDRPVSMYR